MPPVRAVTVGPNALTVLSVTDSTGATKSLAASAIPTAQNTAAKVETWINGTWIPANIVGYAMSVHVFSIGPVKLTVWTGASGMTPESNWWL